MKYRDEQRVDMNSQIDDIIIHPIRTRSDREIPANGVFLVNPGEAHRALAATVKDGGTELFLHNSRLAVSRDNCRFMAGPAIGAPAAVLVMEKLIALGARRIVMMGWCGAIDPEFSIGDIIVPESAVSGEGTSKYYGDIRRPQSSPEARGALTRLLDAAQLQWSYGDIWSTDAPYRESWKFLQHLYREEKIAGVDMEFSALCSVASFRKIDFSAVLIVSDELFSGKWKPGFKNTVFKEKCTCVLDCLLHKKLDELQE